MDVWSKLAAPPQVKVVRVVDQIVWDLARLPFVFDCFGCEGHANWFDLKIRRALHVTVVARTSDRQHYSWSVILESDQLSWLKSAQYIMSVQSGLLCLLTSPKCVQAMRTLRSLLPQEKQYATLC